MNPKIVHELDSVRVSLQQAAENCGPARDKWSTREPHMQAIRRRKWRHRRSLTNALDADLSNRKPILNQSSFGHYVDIMV
jgi:hypothetical protein